ncbi:MAG: hypothetical protein AAF717_00215 [Bacteroidota bacterium]
MTTHYLIHSPTTGRTLKASYRSGKFFRLEKAAGRAFKSTVELGKALATIPALEDEITGYQQTFPTLEYTKVEKQQSMYQQYVSAWFAFYNKFMELSPKFTKADGASLNQIKTYLTRIGGSEQEGLVLFQLILDNWNKLDEFHQNNTDLKYINSRLNLILNAVKKAGKAGTSGADNSVRI